MEPGDRTRSLRQTFVHKTLVMVDTSLRKEAGWPGNTVKLTKSLLLRCWPHSMKKCSDENPAKPTLVEESRFQVQANSTSSQVSSESYINHVEHSVDPKRAFVFGWSSSQLHFQ